MEFKARIEDEIYSFSSLNSTSYLVTSSNNSYIIYKNNQWQCADMIPHPLLKKLGEVIEGQKGPNA